MSWWRLCFSMRSRMEAMSDACRDGFPVEGFVSPDVLDAIKDAHDELMNAEEVVETGTPADVVEAAVDAIERHPDWDASTFRPGG